MEQGGGVENLSQAFPLFNYSWKVLAALHNFGKDIIHCSTGKKLLAH